MPGVIDITDEYLKQNKNYMRIPELEEKISDFIVTTYNATFIGLLEVHKENDLYSLTLGLPSYMSPTTISIDATNDDEFLDYIYTELKLRNYMRLEIYKVIRKNAETET